MIIRPVFCNPQPNDPHLTGAMDTTVCIPLPIEGVGSRCVLVETEPIEDCRTFMHVGILHYLNGKVVSVEEYENALRAKGYLIPRASPYAQGGERLTSVFGEMTKARDREGEFEASLSNGDATALRTLERYQHVVQLGKEAREKAAETQ